MSARSRVIQTNFSGGEFTPRLFGRTDLERYKNGAAELRNMVVLPQGGATRRPGSYYVGGTKSDGGCILRRFIASPTDAYILEIGNLYMRFFRNRGRIMSGGSPLELATPWAAGDLSVLRFEQSNDVLFICHPSFRPRQLRRTAVNAFELKMVDFLDGPYLTENAGTVSDAPSSGTTGSGTAPGAGSAGGSDFGGDPDGGGGGGGSGSGGE